MTKILITGAYGFIGRNLSLFLAKEGNSIAGIGRGNWTDEQAFEWGLSSWISGDVNFENLNLLCNGWGNPDVVYHCAGSSSVSASMDEPLKSIRDTVISTSDLLEWLKKNNSKAPIVMISSAAVYGSEYERPISSNDKEDPISIYGAHKLITEVLCRNYSKQFGMKIVIPRVFSVYGIGLRKQLMWDFCEKVQLKRDIVLGGSGNEMRDWINIRDLVRILSIIPEYANSKACTLNIASGRTHSVHKVVQLISDKFQSFDGLKPNVSFDGKNRLGNPVNLIANTKELEQLNLKASTSIEEGISDYVDWYMSKDRDSF